MQFIQNIQKLKESVDVVARQSISLAKPYNREKAIYNFDEKKKQYHYNSFKSAMASVKGSTFELNSILAYDINNRAGISEILSLVPLLDETADISRLNQAISRIEVLYRQLNVPKEVSISVRNPRNLPQDISSEVIADIRELNRCFDSGCYRSAVMLCGRILETALFRKYFEVTGIDLLEKAPGTGLGNLIAKLAEKNVELDPALANQIHLINQIRIFSVHKKKALFNPSHDQTQAIMLYTLDILDKMF